MDHPTTPDGRYFIYADRLWRSSNPALDDQQQEQLVADLMQARRAVKSALSANNRNAIRAARARVHQCKIALGERGPVWWDDGQPDLNRRMVENTLYADWWASLQPQVEAS